MLRGKTMVIKLLLVILAIEQGVLSINLYHYTDKTGQHAIRNAGYFRSADGAFGTGVYFTAFSPFNHTHSQIAKNNWGGSTTAKTSFVFKVDISSNSVNKATGTLRNIYIYPNKNLTLSETNNWTLYNWTTNTPVQIATKFLTTIKPTTTTTSTTATTAKTTNRTSVPSDINGSVTFIDKSVWVVVSPLLLLVSSAAHY